MPRSVPRRARRFVVGRAKERAPGRACAESRVGVLPRVGHRLRVAVWGLACLTLWGCAGRGGEGAQVGAEVDPHAPIRLYPMAEGTVWTYDVDTGQGTPTLAITRVVELAGSRVTVSSGGEPVRYEIRDEGLYRLDRGGWLLKAPVRVGESWDAGNGATARVVEGEHAVSTLAGDFRGCLTVEETGGRAGLRVRTTYCPDVGPVQVESILQDGAGGARARVSAELRGYALRGL